MKKILFSLMIAALISSPVAFTAETTSGSSTGEVSASELAQDCHAASDEDNDSSTRSLSGTTQGGKGASSESAE